MVPKPVTDPATEASDKTASQLKRWAPLVLLLIGIGAAYASGAHKYLSLGAIAEHRDSLQQMVAQNLVLAIGGYFVVYVATVAFSLPGAALLTILGGFLFGPYIAGTTTVVAATIGATAIFLIAKTSVGDALARRAGPWIKALADGFREDAFNYLLFLRLVPLFPFWLVNIAPALFNVRLSTFAVATFLGIIPGTFAFAIVGSGLDSIIEAQRAANQECIASKGVELCPFKLDAGALVTPKLIVGFIALGIVALIPVVLKRLRARQNASR